MAKRFELYLHDLAPDAQGRYKAFAGDDVSEFFPIAVLELQDDVEGDAHGS